MLSHESRVTTGCKPSIPLCLSTASSKFRAKQAPSTGLIYNNVVPNSRRRCLLSSWTRFAGCGVIVIVIVIVSELQHQPTSETVKSSIPRKSLHLWQAQDFSCGPAARASTLLTTHGRSIHHLPRSIVPANTFSIALRLIFNLVQKRVSTVQHGMSDVQIYLSKPLAVQHTAHHTLPLQHSIMAAMAW